MGSEIIHAGSAKSEPVRLLRARISSVMLVAVSHRPVRLAVVANLDLPAEPIVEDLGSQSEHLVENVGIIAGMGALNKSDHR
jgi:hypothetical protein